MRYEQRQHVRLPRHRRKILRRLLHHGLLLEHVSQHVQIRPKRQKRSQIQTNRSKPRKRRRRSPQRHGHLVIPPIRKHGPEILRQHDGVRRRGRKLPHRIPGTQETLFRPLNVLQDKLLCFECSADKLPAYCSSL